MVIWLLKKLFFIVLGLLIVLLIFIVVGLLRAPDYLQITTPAGYPINTIQYLPLDEQTSIWISVWLPDNLGSDERIPAIMTTSRYSEMLESGWLLKVLEGNFSQPDRNHAQATQGGTDHGYAYVYVQSPGSCQSSGPRPMEYPPAEIDAMRLVIDWIVQQPWSNGRVGTIGHSYSATTADMSCATERSALRAAYPEAPDFDLYTQNARPGGLGSMEFMQTWGRLVQAMDADDICGVVGASEKRRPSILECLVTKSMIRGLQRPKGKDRPIFEQALADHRNNLDVASFIRLLEYKDARIEADPLHSLTIDELSLYRYRQKIERAQVNTITTVGWMDAGTVEGALQKYLTFSTPQVVVIQPTGHAFDEHVDPFGSNVPWTKEELETYDSGIFAFFDRHLRENSAPEDRHIRYWTFGENAWHETISWPPEGIVMEPWYFSAERMLGPEQPMIKGATDSYTVNFSASTGYFNRWMTQMGEPVRYEDRGEEDRKLLTYTSKPCEQDLEVTGSPTIVLYCASTHTDGAFHVYLEDVSPDGRVSYLTEGMLRAIHRKTRDPAEAPAVQLGVWHSFTREDAEPLVPGEMTEIAITLFPISTVFLKGHRIRIALAGHDQALVDRYPPEGIPVLTIERSIARPSHVILPVRRHERDTH